MGSRGVKEILIGVDAINAARHLQSGGGLTGAPEALTSHCSNAALGLWWLVTLR